MRLQTVLDGTFSRDITAIGATLDQSAAMSPHLESAEGIMASYSQLLFTRAQTALSEATWNEYFPLMALFRLGAPDLAQAIMMDEDQVNSAIERYQGTDGSMSRYIALAYPQPGRQFAAQSGHLDFLSGHVESELRAINANTNVELHTESLMQIYFEQYILTGKVTTVPDIADDKWNIYKGTNLQDPDALHLATISLSMPTRYSEVNTASNWEKAISAMQQKIDRNEIEAAVTDYIALLIVHNKIKISPIGIEVVEQNSYIPPMPHDFMGQ